MIGVGGGSSRSRLYDIKRKSLRGKICFPYGSEMGRAKILFLWAEGIFEVALMAEKVTVLARKNDYPG
jgi:hypothetical protein